MLADFDPSEDIPDDFFDGLPNEYDAEASDEAAALGMADFSGDLYAGISSSSTCKHFANQRRIIQERPNLYCTATSYWTGTGTIGHTYSTVHLLAAGRQGCS